MLKHLKNKYQNKFGNINSKNGIALIVLLITLVIMLIIAMTVILIYKDNQTSKDANYAVLKNDMEVMVDKFTLTYGNKLKSVGYDKTKITNSDFDSVIPDKYKDRFKATTSGIIYLGNDEKIIEIAKDLNIKIEEAQ
jgi:Tfp pilus assembly protein PilE